MYKQTITFGDVLLEPQYSDITSRKEVSLSTPLDDLRKLKIPIIASPMDTVSEWEMASSLSSMGGMAIVHRYNTIEEQANQVKTALSVPGCSIIGAAVGVSGDYIERASECYGAGARVICIDVAHGDHAMVKTAIASLRDLLGMNIHIMAGNVATLEGFNRLADWGADSIRVGIGGGCFTPGTLVRTENGDKPIEQVRLGEMVLTHTGELHKVVDTMTFQRDEEIYIINGVESTSNHEYYVVKKEDAGLVNENNIQDHAFWIEAEHLDKEKHLLIELEE
jgi:IMP dehydrogenase/GMP reductase